MKLTLSKEGLDALNELKTSWEKTCIGYKKQSMEMKEKGLPSVGQDYSVGCYKSAIHDLELLIKKFSP